MAAPSIMITSASSRTPDLMINVGEILNVEKSGPVNPTFAAGDMWEIIFTMNNGVDPSYQLIWKYTTAALRNTAFAAVKTAINTALT